MKSLSLSNAIKLMVVIGLLAVFAVVVQSCQSPKNGLDIYRTKSLKRLHVSEAPPIQPRSTFSSADGLEMKLSDYRGQYVLLNVWATWCPPCIIEMPSLNELQKKRGGDRFKVVTISMDRKAEDAVAFLEKNGLDNLEPWHDPSFGLNVKVKTRGLPISIFYDPKGREIARVSGEADWASEEALELIDHLLQRPR